MSCVVVIVLHNGKPLRTDVVLLTAVIPVLGMMAALSSFPAFACEWMKIFVAIVNSSIKLEAGW